MAYLGLSTERGSVIELELADRNSPTAYTFETSLWSLPGKDILKAYFTYHMIAALIEDQLSEKRTCDVYLTYEDGQHQRLSYVGSLDDQVNDFSVSQISTEADLEQDIHKYQIMAATQWPGTSSELIIYYVFETHQKELIYYQDGPSFVYLESHRNCASRIESTQHIVIVACEAEGIFEVLALETMTTIYSMNEDDNL